VVHQIGQGLGDQLVEQRLAGDLNLVSLLRDSLRSLLRGPQALAHRRHRADQRGDAGLLPCQATHRVLLSGVQPSGRLLAFPVEPTSGRGELGSELRLERPRLTLDLALEGLDFLLRRLQRELLRVLLCRLQGRDLLPEPSCPEPLGLAEVLE